MSRNPDFKAKLPCLIRMFTEETDEKHAKTVPDIQEYLLSYGIKTERKALYSDFATLRRFGYDIVMKKRGTDAYYYLGERQFELSELKLLVDAIQSSKLLTEKRSEKLIKKLEALTSKHQADQLHDQVLIAGRVKSNNEKVFYNIDELNEAISSDRQITFYYYQWTVAKRMKRRRDGKQYVISPWALMWDDENYYLVGYDAEADLIKHFRVDKIIGIEMTKQPREGRRQFEDFDLPKYTKSMFGMFGGEETTVVLEGTNEMVGTIIDRFGKDVPIEKVDKKHFRATVNVMVSNQFLGWVMSLGEGVWIAGPEDVRERMITEIERLQLQYQ